MKESEFPYLEEFLYQAIFQKDEKNPIPRSVIKDPSVNIYIKDFGKKTDLALVAENHGMIIGCVWTRILAGDIKGFGNIDSRTPEFAISLLKDYRGLGIGSALMESMLNLLKKKGFKKASLAVQKENYAYWLYKKIGFKTVRETKEEYIMVHQLN